MPGNSRVNHGGAFGDGLFLRQGPDACQNDWPRSSSLSSREPAGYTPTPRRRPAPARVPAPDTRPTAPHLAHNARPVRYTATPSGAVSAGSNPAWAISAATQRQPEQRAISGGNDVPAAVRIASRLRSASSVCASMPSPGTPVAGSKPAVPEQNTNPRRRWPGYRAQAQLVQCRWRLPS